MDCKPSSASLGGVKLYSLESHSLSRQLVAGSTIGTRSVAGVRPKLVPGSGRWWGHLCTGRPVVSRESPVSYGEPPETPRTCKGESEERKVRLVWRGQGIILYYKHEHIMCVCFSPHLSVGFFFSISHPASRCRRRRPSQTTQRSHTQRSHTHRDHTYRDNTHRDHTHTQITHTEITHTEITHTEITHTETTTQRSHTQRSHTPRPHIPRQHAQRSHTPGSVRGSGGCLVGAGRLWSGVGASDAVPL